MNVLEPDKTPGKRNLFNFAFTLPFLVTGVDLKVSLTVPLFIFLPRKMHVYLESFTDFVPAAFSQTIIYPRFQVKYTY